MTINGRLWRVRALVVLGLVLAASGVVAARPAQAEDPKGPAYRVDDISLVYLGNPRLFKHPCVVSADRVYRAIPEYREILEKNLTDRDVRYHFLLRKASDKFAVAIREVSQSGGYDLVAGVGSVSAATAGTPAPTDVTDSVIGKLPA
jgi:predicted secreted protein